MIDFDCPEISRKVNVIYKMPNLRLYKLFFSQCGDVIQILNSVEKKFYQLKNQNVCAR